MDNKKYNRINSKNKTMPIIQHKRRAFMARTHALLSVVILLSCMLLPFDFFRKTIWVLRDDIVLFIVGLIVLIGSSLLVDLDNPVSKAGSVLGPFGSILTIFMQSISSIVWTVYHSKRDMVPMSQHRYLWHTPIIGISLIMLFYYNIPAGNYNIITNFSTAISENQFEYFIRTNTVLLLFLILVFMSALIGSSIIVQYLKRFNVNSMFKYILPILVLLYVLTTTYSNLRILGALIGFGYLFHILEDFFTDSGVPLLWPIPSVWFKKVWARYHFPITITTGGSVNSIIDILALFAMIILFVIVLTSKPI